MAEKDTTSSYVGISNENEFYSQHYLSEIFKGDIKSILDTWLAAETASEGQQEDQYKTPFNRLKALHKDYFAIRDRLSPQRKAAGRNRPCNRLQSADPRPYENIMNVWFN